MASMTSGATYDVHVRWMLPHVSFEALLAGEAWATVAQKMKTRYVTTARMPAVIMDNIRRAAGLGTSTSQYERAGMKRV